ncbi:MAG: glycosyltransferase family 4 protein [Planctomycetota bacterium]
MRILQGSYFYGPFGGVERYVRELSLHQREAGHEIELLTRRVIGEPKDGFRVHVLPDAEKVTKEERIRGDAEGLRRAVAEFRPDLIHLHNNWEAEFTRACLELAPTVRSIHDHTLFCPGLNKEHADRSNCFTPAGWRCWVQLAQGGCDCWKLPLKRAWRVYWDKMDDIRANKRLPRLITPSEYMRQELLAIGFGARQVEVNELYVDLLDPPPVFTPADPPRILCVGRMVLPDKGADFLLECLARIDRPFQADLVGDGPHFEAIKNLAGKLGLAGRVTLHGWVEAAEKDRLYRNANVFAFPATWKEPVGFVGFEAMVYGLPVVAQDVGGIKEWLCEGEIGHVTPPKDPAAYAAALARLCADPETCRRMGQNGQRLVAERFQRKDHLARLEKTYEEVLARLSARREGP